MIKYFMCIFLERRDISFLLLCRKVSQTQQLKQSAFIIWQFLWVRSLGVTLLDLLLRVSQSCNQDLSLGCILLWSLESSFSPHSYWQNSVPVTVGPRSVFSCCHLGPVLSIQRSPTFPFVGWQLTSSSKENLSPLIQFYIM